MENNKEDLETADYITTKQLSEGFENLPKISDRTQKYLRKNKLINYTKIGRTIYYTKNWVLDYIKNNTVARVN